MKSKTNLIRKGMRVADANIYQHDQIWSRYSNDKVQIGEGLGYIIRFLYKKLPLYVPLRALSIGSSAEPQFRVLASTFRGGLYLLDMENQALEIIRERIERQSTRHVFPMNGDFNKVFATKKSSRQFLLRRLHTNKMHLITFHHSLYYAPMRQWMELFRNISVTMAKASVVHSVLMASESENPYTTTWLYNHFAGKFFGHVNDQNLTTFGHMLRRGSAFKKHYVYLKTHEVRFFINDFEKFMSVIWMVLLHPNVHRFNERQKKEVTEHVYAKFWVPRRPLLQLQDNLILSTFPFKPVKS